NFYSAKIKLHFIIQKDSLVKIRGFSTYQFAFSFINYFSRNLDNLLIGKVMGQSALGYYDKAYKLMLYPVGNLTHVITPVLHPILSDYQHDKKYIYEQYRRIVKILSLLGVFVSVYCYFAADEAILIMFGEQWTNSIPTFKILSLTIWAQMIMSSSGTIFQSLGETKGLFRAGLITTTINVIGIVIGLLLGTIESIAFMILLTFSINFIITFIILIKMVMGYNVINFFKMFIPELGIVLLMSIILVYVSKLYITNILISAIVKFIFASIGYSLGLILTKQFTYFKLFLKR
ncbi:oligosaccharide flippase family protein, partial [Turicibacter sanguinis]|nr:oligosaccharide flippase family protein [Turicibacter sanguinis]